MELQPASVRSLIIKELKPHQKLLAVSKLQDFSKIQKLFSEGQIHFAENYIQEALEKIEKLRDLHIQWHLIGPIQKNKVKLLKNHFEYIHSLDSLELATKISEKAVEINFIQKVFIQLNLSDEVTKSGFSLIEFQSAWKKLTELNGLKIVGLMTMPPLENEPVNNRKYFQQLKKIGQDLNLNEFSMGTSHDYKIALEEGATWIRLGTSLFGERSQK